MLDRWIARTIAVALAGAIAACTRGNTPHRAAQDVKSLQGQIAFWAELPVGAVAAPDSRNREVLRSTIQEFRALHPKAQISIKTFPPGQAQAAFARQIRRGAGPDLLLLQANPQLVELIAEGLLQELDEEAIETDQFRTEALKHIYYDGKLYGVPLYLETQVLCYNKDKVDRLPETLPDLIDSARRGYSVGLQSGFLETYWGTGIFGGRTFDYLGRINALQWYKWAHWMEWLKDAQNEPNLILSDDEEALQQAFIERKLAYVTCFTGWIPDFIDALGKDSLGATLLPGNPRRPATPVLRTGVLLFSQASNSRQTQLAIELARFLTNVEQQKQVEAAIPFIPSNTEVTIDPRLFPIRSTIFRQSEAAVAVDLDTLQNAATISGYGDRLYNRVLAGEISPALAARKLSDLVEQQQRRRTKP